MAAKQPAVGIDHVTVVPTNAARDDERTTADGDDRTSDDEGKPPSAPSTATIRDGSGLPTASGPVDNGSRVCARAPERGRHIPGPRQGG
ncbi:hypothetical protein ACFQFH_14615 [Halobaculum halobium]|uniref:hypothetical protein n=1 Tax=Halobaculum halobium TaxID=3032281 RepID=UPI00360E67B4